MPASTSTDGDAVAAVARDARRSSSSDGVTTLDGRDVSAEIRGPRGDRRGVAGVGAPAGARGARRRGSAPGWREHGGGVVEGRDIGTVVLPDAPVKVFLTAQRRGAGRGAVSATRPRRDRTVDGRRRAGRARPTRPRRRARSGAPRVPRTPPPTRSSSTPATSTADEVVADLVARVPEHGRSRVTFYQFARARRARACSRCVFRVRVVGKEHVPTHGRVHRRPVAPVDPRHAVRRVHHRAHDPVPGQGRAVRQPARATALRRPRRGRGRARHRRPRRRCARSRRCCAAGEPVASSPRARATRARRSPSCSPAPPTSA